MDDLLVASWLLYFCGFFFVFTVSPLPPPVLFFLLFLPTCCIHPWAGASTAWTSCNKKIYVGILFFLKLPVSLCGLQIEVKGITGGYVSALAHVSHASVIWAVVKPGNTMVGSLTYEEKAKHKGGLIKSFVKQNKKPGMIRNQFCCKLFLFPVAMGPVISCHEMQRAESSYFF